MKKIKNYIVLGAVIVFSACANQAEKLNIPEGEYMLLGSRGLSAMECGMTETTFGKTLIINNGKINTEPINPLKGLESVHYPIKKVEENYLTTFYRPLEQDTSMIQFLFDAEKEQLIFQCESTQIVYQKK